MLAYGDNVVIFLCVLYYLQLKKKTSFIMSTSLAEQLKKLAVPQTSLLIQGKTRPSLLFDPREAAKFDRETIYEIGINVLFKNLSIHYVEIGLCS